MWAPTFAFLALSRAAEAQRNPPDQYNITSDLRASPNGTDQLIFVINRSDESIVVNGVTLIDCENIQGSCGTRPMNVRVFAGSEAMVYRVRRRYEDSPSGFRYRFSYKSDRPNEAPSAPAEKAAKEKVLPAPEPPPLRPPRDSAPAVRPDSIVIKLPPPGPVGPVDTVMVVPAALTVHVGESVSLSKALVISARDAKQNAVPGVRIRISVEIGTPYVKVDQGAVVGLKEGTAVLLIAPARPPGATGEPKGASRVVVRVLQ